LLLLVDTYGREHFGQAKQHVKTTGQKSPASCGNTSAPRVKKITSEKTPHRRMAERAAKRADNGRGEHAPRANI